MEGDGNFMKLEDSILIENPDEFEFVIADRVDLTEIKNGIIIFRGKIYNFEDGKAEHESNAEVHLSAGIEHFFQLSDEGSIID